MKRFIIKEKRFVFYNQFIDKNTIKQLINRLVVYLGSECTSHILDQIKSLGFKHATSSGISLGIDDLLTTPSKIWILKDSEFQIYNSEQQYLIGSINAIERLRHVVETWHITSEYLKRLMHPHFKTIDPLNPIHIMSFSGARGSTSQVHQLVGMRGLMANPQGNIIDLPIQANFREGLSLTEYIISCYGARKGVVDTAVRTADAGYLTRRLVEICQQAIVSKYDCYGKNGIYLNNIKDQQHSVSLLSLQDRLIGRVLAQNVIVKGRCIAKNKQDIGPDLANSLSTLKNYKILIRSPLTCESMPHICQLCYGWDLSYANLVEIGTAIGVIAGQSIGEPGTQLTLRTFHTGGVFTGDVAEHVRAPCNGFVIFSSNNVQATRNRHGRLALICTESIFVTIISEFNNTKNAIPIPKHSLLMVTNHQYVQSKQVIAEVRTSVIPSKQTVQKDIYSNIEGTIFHKHTSLYTFSSNYYQFMKLRLYDFSIKSLFYIGSSKYLFNSIVDKADYVWIISSKLHNISGLNLFNVFYKSRDYIQKNLFIAKAVYAVKLLNYLFQIFKKKEKFFFNENLSKKKNFSQYNGSILRVDQQNKCILILSSSDQFNRFTINKNKYKYTIINSCHLKKKKKIKNKNTNLYSYKTISKKSKNQRYLGFLGIYFSKLQFQKFRFMHNTDIEKRKFSSVKKNIRCIQNIVYIDDKSSINYIINFRVTFLLFKYLYSIWYSITQRKNSFIVGQFVFKNVFNHLYGIFSDSGQILCLSKNFLTLSSTKPYLVTKDTQIHNYHGNIVQEGHRLLTFMYERLKASDIIQGLPKAEQLLEARVGNKTISILDSRFQFLIQDLKRKISRKISSLIEMDFFISRLSINKALKALKSSQIEILNEIQNVYLWQGVFIADKHIEIVIRQMTSKAIIIENADLCSIATKGIIRNTFPYQTTNLYLPGELLDLFKAQKINNILLNPISCKPILLGITKASLNTDSFLAEASFERTVTVLSKSAIKGRNDWLKGLKENVLFSNLIPVGTGSYKINLRVLKKNKTKIESCTVSRIFSIYSFSNNLFNWNSIFNQQLLFNQINKRIDNQIFKTPVFKEKEDFSEIF